MRVPADAPCSLRDPRLNIMDKKQKIYEQLTHVKNLLIELYHASEEAATVRLAREMVDVLGESLEEMKNENN